MGNENSALTTVDLSEVYVNPDFVNMKNKLMSDRKGFTVIHGTMEAEFKKNVSIIITKLIAINPLLNLHCWVQQSKILSDKPVA